MRALIARQIIVLHVILIIILIIFYVTGGFHFDEFSSTLALLTAFTSSYAGISSHFFTLQIKNKENEVDETESKNISHVKFLKWVVPLHFILVIIILTLKALPLINFQEMVLFLGIVESCTGVYIGHIVVAVFGIK